MRYNPEIHHRRSIRLKNHDYSLDGAYFVTMCTFDRGCYFDQFEQLRQIIEKHWQSMPKRFLEVELDEYVIMPNHFHAIIILRTDDGRLQAAQPQEAPRPKANLGEIIGAFKSLCVNEWLRVIKEKNINTRGRFWQGNYYEHIVRNDEEMERIRQYIADNPRQWKLDRENPGFDKCQRSNQPETWMV